MFHNIPEPMQQRMRELEAIDALDRTDGTLRLQRLRQIPPITGKFIALMAANAPEGQIVEIGTSAGYSSMWLALACKQRAQKLVTFEVLEEKISLAKQTFRSAEIEDQVILIQGDAREHLLAFSEIAFCFLDAEKEVYQACYDLLIPRMVPGGLLLADNSISARETLETLLLQAEADLRVDMVDVPIGKGVMVCRKI